MDMMGAGPGWHMLWMLVPLAMLIGLGVLAGYWLLPAGRDDVPRPGFGSARAAEGARGAHGEVRDLLIVIPDISGYTHFVTTSRLALAHAHLAISQLLEAVMEAGSTMLRPMRLEGDAVVFQAPARGYPPDAVGACLMAIMRAFYRRRARLVRENGCPCGSCRSVDALDLKIVAHHGEVLRYRLGSFEDLTGEAIIVAHRLLKNRVGMTRYVLVTESAAPLVRMPAAAPARPHVESFEGVGEVRAGVHAIDLDELGLEVDAEKPVSSVRRLRDLGRKLLATRPLRRHG